jgi:hypothetical protein
MPSPRSRLAVNYIQDPIARAVEPFNKRLYETVLWEVITSLD